MIEEEEDIVNVKVQVVHECGIEIERHDLNVEMNPIAYEVYLQMVNQNESLKLELLDDYRSGFKTNNT